jgi:hypothetical protein
MVRTFTFENDEIRDWKRPKSSLAAVRRAA